MDEQTKRALTNMQSRVQTVQRLLVHACMEGGMTQEEREQMALHLLGAVEFIRNVSDPS